jgi:hypothetical protein
MIQKNHFPVFSAVIHNFTRKWIFENKFFSKY